MKRVPAVPLFPPPPHLLSPPICTVDVELMPVLKEQIYRLYCRLRAECAVKTEVNFDVLGFAVRHILVPFVPVSLMVCSSVVAVRTLCYRGPLRHEWFGEAARRAFNVFNIMCY